MWRRHTELSSSTHTPHTKSAADCSPFTQESPKNFTVPGHSEAPPAPTAPLPNGGQAASSAGEGDPPAPPENRLWEITMGRKWEVFSLPSTN